MKAIVKFMDGGADGSYWYVAIEGTNFVLTENNRPYSIVQFDEFWHNSKELAQKLCDKINGKDTLC